MSGTTCASPAYPTTTGTPKQNGPRQMTTTGNGTRSDHNDQKKPIRCSFQMPLHYPKFKRADYETMPEWKLDSLLAEYGLPVTGDLKQKRKFAMGAFLWPCQNN